MRGAAPEKPSSFVLIQLDNRTTEFSRDIVVYHDEDFTLVDHDQPPGIRICSDGSGPVAKLYSLPRNELCAGH